MATAYQGDKPYVFLSYSHKDEELALSVIEYLQEKNFNVWYDEGIPSGTRWENIIADKIASPNCWMMVFLATKNSLVSDWCGNELRFAKEEGKKFINVVIGEPTIPNGFKLSYSGYQFLYEKNFPNRKAMMDKLVKDLLYHELNPNNPKDIAKETPKAKAPEVAKVPKVPAPTQKSSEPSVAPKGPLKLSIAKGLQFSIVDGTAKVTSYKGTDTEVIIPTKVTYNGNSYKVTAIGEFAFYDCKNLTAVSIPDSVTSIYDYAFTDCKNLTSINIPNGVISIGSFAFNMCESLVSITISNSVATIGVAAFAGCKNLTSINIPNSVTSIGEQAFSGCSSLTSIIIPDSVTSIDGGMFSYCINLTSITIPYSVTSIGERAFWWCDKLTIYCEAKSKPSNWHANWNPDNRPVVWGHKIK